MYRDHSDEEQVSLKKKKKTTQKCVSENMAISKQVWSHKMCEMPVNRCLAVKPSAAPLGRDGC